MVLNTQMTQQVVEKLQQLAPQQVASVIAFIDVLIAKQLPTPPTGLPSDHNTGVRLGLLEVRKRLAKIPGKMSDTVRELRDERG